MTTIELTGDQIDDVVRDELTYLLDTLHSSKDKDKIALMEHVAAVLDYYSVPPLGNTKDAIDP